MVFRVSTPSTLDYAVLVNSWILVGLLALQHIETPKASFLSAVSYEQGYSVLGGLAYMEKNSVESMYYEFCVTIMCCKPSNLIAKNGWTSFVRIVLCITGSQLKNVLLNRM